MSPVTHRPTLGRRGFLIAAGAVLAAPLAACGGSDDDRSSAPAAEGEATDRFPVTVEHKFGRTEIGSAPQRVVAVGYNDQDFALALGVRPLGFRQFQGADISGRPWAVEALAGAKPELVGETEIEFEKIAALRPDLVLAVYSGIAKGDYDKLAQIAPTVAQTDAFVDYGMPWKDQLELTGRALGRSAAARTVATDVQRKIASARKTLDADGRTLALGSGGAGSSGSFSAFATADLRSRFFTALGLEIPAEIDRLAGRSFYTDLSAERLDLLDRDALVIYGAEAELAKSPTFARLDVVREDRTIYLDEQGAISQAIGFSSPLSIPYALDRIVPRLRAALDDDPKTVPEGTGPDAD